MTSPAPIPAARTLALLRWSAVALAFVSLGALVSHVFGWLPMPYFLEVFGVPSLVLLLALAAFAKKINAALLVNGLWVGVGAGLIASLVYDGVRWLVTFTHLFGYTGFVPILMFGHWITGAPLDSTPAAIAGWSYHYWNGMTFGVIYTLGAGRVAWGWGILYGILMECCMLGLFPMFLKVNNRFDFVMVSMIGHVAYGATLGLLARRWLIDTKARSAP